MARRGVSAHMAFLHSKLRSMALKPALFVSPKAAHRGLIYGNLRVHSQDQQWPVAIIGTAHE